MNAYRKILVAVDGSSASAKGLREALRLAKSERASLCIFHVVDEYPAFADLTARLVKAFQYLNEHPDELIDAVFVGQYGLPAERAEELLQGGAGTAAFFPIPGEVEEQQQALADLFVAAGQIPEEIDVSTEFEWFVGGVSVGVSRTLDGLHRGEMVYARIRAWDGDDSSTPVSSPVVVVGNALPRVTRAAMIPAMPTEADAVTADVAATDADGDPVTFAVEWQADGAPIHVGSTLPAGLAPVGALLSYTVVPNDGLADGPSARSPEVTVGGAL